MKEPKIVISQEKRMIGMKLEMSIAEDQTFKLFSTFMPRKKEIASKSKDIFSVQVYHKEIAFKDFEPKTMYTKWAAVEVDENHSIPLEMEELRIPKGKYAVFLHRGTVLDFLKKTNPFIYKKWLPASGFSLADRPHYQVMGAKYLGQDHPESEEEVWIPID